MSDRRLQLVLELRDKVMAPLRGITSGSKEAAAALKATRDQLRDLEKAQQDIDGLRKTRVQLRGQQRDLQDLQTKLAASNASLTDHRERHKNIAASLKTARESHGKLTKALQDGATATPEFSRQLEMARIRLLSSQTAYERSNSTLSKYRTQIKTTEAGIAQLSGKIDNGKERLQGYQQRLEKAGISTERLGQQSRNQKTQIEAATAAMERQKQALAGLKAQQDKLAALKEKHAKAMVHTGMMAGTGVAMVAGGRTMAKPVQATLGAFSQQEDSSTQLRAAMMQSDGSVQKEFAEINELAKRLGDRLPGTTADFIDMMTVLRKEGISAKAILGGTGEAAALLGVQLKMPVTGAAEFAAKMQDATQATESEMLGLMDVLQKNAYLGADQNYQLAGITKMAGAMSLIRQKGEEAYKTLSPLLVMMNQAGMTDGGSAGNAIDKVFAAGLDSKKLQKTNDMLKPKGIKLNFADKNGKFAGIENLFKQLDKLKALGDNDILKTKVLSELFGTDAQNMQVLRNFMAKGYDGYQETVAKMEAQASLQQRVEEQLGTLSNVMEAAQGGFTNVMADIGDTIKGDAKDIIKAVGDITSSVGGWIKEHPALTAGIARTMAVLAGLMVVLGTLLIPLALIAGKFMLMRFLIGMLGVKVPMLSAGISALTGMVTKLTGALFSGLMVALRATMGAIVKLGVALLTTPVGWFVLAIAAIAGAAYLIYKNWGAISGFFSGVWGSVKTQAAAAWTSIKGSLSGLWSSSVSTAKTIWAGLPGFFSGMWQGIKDTASAVWSGISSMLGQMWAGMVSTASTLWQQMGGSFPAVLQTISAAIINWSPLGLFYQAFAAVMSYFGFELPTKFSEFGANIIQGLVNGITSKLAMVRDAVGTAADSAVGWFKEKLGIHSPSRVFMAAGVNVGEGAAIGIGSTVDMLRKSAAAMAMAAGVTLAAPTMAAPVIPVPQLGAIGQTVELPRATQQLTAAQVLAPLPAQVVDLQPAAAQALPPAAQQLLPVLHKLPPLPAQTVDLQPDAAKALPPAAQQLLPVLHKLPPLPAQVVDLQPAAAPALPPAAQQLLPVLQKLPPLPAQVVDLQPAAAPALPPAAQQLLPVLQKLPPLPAQAVNLQPAAAQALPPAAQQLLPVLQKLPPLPAQVVDLQPAAAQALPPAAQQLLPVLQKLPPVPVQAVSLQPAAAQALPPAAQQLLPVLHKLPPLPAQAVELQPAAAPALPPAAQQLLPVLQKLPPVPAQAVNLQPAAAKALPPAAQQLLPVLHKLPPLPAQAVDLQPDAAKALPPAAQQLLPVLHKLPPLPAQAVELQPAAAPALPPAAQQLLPVLQKLPPVPAQAVNLQPVMQQMQAMPAQQLPALPAMAEPVQIDRRPVLAQPAPAAQRPAPIIQGDTITIQVHAAPGMDMQELAREVQRQLDQRDRAKAARLQASYTDWN